MADKGRWFGSVLNPKEIGRGDAPVFCHLVQHADGNEAPSHQWAGFFCAAHSMADPGPTCEGNDHGGWTDMAEMARAMADAMENPGCDIRIILEPVQP